MKDITKLISEQLRAKRHWLDKYPSWVRVLIIIGLGLVAVFASILVTALMYLVGFHKLFI